MPHGHRKFVHAVQANALAAWALSSLHFRVFLPSKPLISTGVATATFAGRGAQSAEGETHLEHSTLHTAAEQCAGSHPCPGVFDKANPFGTPMASQLHRMSSMSSLPHTLGLTPPSAALYSTAWIFWNPSSVRHAVGAGDLDILVHEEARQTAAPRSLLLFECERVSS